MKGKAMLSSLFLSKNQKLVKKWKREHEEIVVLATHVLSEYSKNNIKSAKKLLKKLNIVAVDHMMNEDLEFYKLLKDQKRLTETNEKSIHQFKKSFKNTKLTLMTFLSKYSRDDVELDDTFFKSFNDLVDVLAKRIDFEENNLYTILNQKQ
jgi:hypothetical protein